MLDIEMLKKWVQFAEASGTSRGAFEAMLQTTSADQIKLFASVAEDLWYEWVALTWIPGFAGLNYLDELVLAGRRCGCDLTKRPCGALSAFCSLLRRMRGDNWQ